MSVVKLKPNQLLDQLHYSTNQTVVNTKPKPIERFDRKKALAICG